MDWSKGLYLFIAVGYLILCSLLLCCRQQTPSQSENPGSTLHRPEYARGFEWEIKEGITILRVTRPWSGAQSSLSYALVPQDKSLPPGIKADQVISIPVTSMVVTSTSHIPALDLLEASHCLSGFPQTHYISSSIMRQRIDRNQIQDIGAANGLNYEALIALDPQLIMTYQSGPDGSEREALRLTGIPHVLNSDFLEETPLGRAEWIKFTGLLLNKYAEADSIFRQIEHSYQQLTEKVQQRDSRPRVFSGSLYGDSWFAPAGNSFVAKFIEDAGGEYVWKGDQQSGNLELSFEAVMEISSQTDFWLGVGGFTSLSELKRADPRYANFSAFQNDRVFNYHGRRGATGGFEYLELGGARPDVVLSDFIKILHPQVLPDYDLYFFKKLGP